MVQQSAGSVGKLAKPGGWQDEPAEQVAISAGSPFVGRRLGDTRTRTLTGASIVAVLRDREVIASPGPSFVFEVGDVVVVVGTRKGLDGVTNILATGETGG